MPHHGGADETGPSGDEDGLAVEAHVDVADL